MSEKKKETTMDAPWYKQDAERKREAILNTIEVRSLANTLKEIILYQEFLFGETRWLESVVTTLILPQLEAGRTRESIMNEWAGMIQTDN